MFLQNVGSLSKDYTVLYPGRQNSSLAPYFAKRRDGATHSGVKKKILPKYKLGVS
jgi:hypothetical protein